VFYTATSAGFINILEDAGGDGNFLPGGAGVTTPVRTIALTNLTAGGIRLSSSASVTGLVVQQDAELDGDVNSDEIVYFTVFDPEFGTSPAPPGGPNPTPRQVSFIGIIFDGADADEIPDTAQLLIRGFNEISLAGLGMDSLGHLYWPLTNLNTGVILNFKDTNENRVVFDSGDSGTASLYTFVGGAAPTALDLGTVANSVGIVMDRNDNLYLQVAAGDQTVPGCGPANTGLPAAVVSYVDRCGDVDPLTGVIPRPDGLADTLFRIYAAQRDVDQTAGAGDPNDSPVLILPDLQIDYSGYGGIDVDYDDNLYVAVGAAPAGESGDPSPFCGSILRIPDKNCDRVGDSVDFDGNRVFGTSNLFGYDTDDATRTSDYLWVQAPLQAVGRTPTGIGYIDFGPLFSLNRVGLLLGDDDGMGFAFDAADGIANNIAGGDADILRASGSINVGTNTAGGTRGFEFLMMNVAWTGFRLGSNGSIALRNSALRADADPALVDNSPTIPEFLTGGTTTMGVVIAPLFTDLNPGDDFLAPAGFGGQFSVNRIGFAAVDAYIIQWINFPQYQHGGAGVNVDPFGRLGPAQINSFDVTLFDDQDFWDDVDAEFVQDTTNVNNNVNNDNDGVAAPAGIGFARQNQTGGVTQIIDRNGDGDTTDENILDSSVVQEGVGRTIPEQGPFLFRYHQIEAVGTAAVPVIVGFTTGFDPVFNVGTIPPGLCEINLSRETPAFDDPFYYCGAIGCGTEPSLFEIFNSGREPSQNTDGTLTGPLIDVDLRQEVIEDCFIRAERVIDTQGTECLRFKGSNIPVGLFCTSVVRAPATPTNPNNPFLGATDITVNGFNFPMPTTGANEVCSQFCGTTAPAVCRNGKSITCQAVIAFDEDGNGTIDATVTLTETAGTPNLGRVQVISENQIVLQGVNLAQTDICGGVGTITVSCTYSNFDGVNGANNKYFETRLNAAGAQVVGPVTNVCVANAGLGLRAPVVTSIAPDFVSCNNPDDSTDRVEDVQINGICFGRITSAFLTTTADGSGTRIPINNVLNITRNTVTGTITIASLTPATPYYVFVVRSDGAISTSYPNVFGFDVTFSCRNDVTPPPPNPGPTLTSCRVRRVALGKFVLQVNGSGFLVNNTIVLLNGTPCPRTKYPSKFFGDNNTTTRLNCTGGIKNLLPATVTTRNADGVTSRNSLQCDFS